MRAKMNQRRYEEASKFIPADVALSKLRLVNILKSCAKNGGTIGRNCVETPEDLVKYDFGYNIVRDSK